MKKYLALAFIFFVALFFQSPIASGDGVDKIPGEENDIVTEEKWSEVIKDTVEKFDPVKKKDPVVPQQKKAPSIVDSEAIDKQVETMVDRSKRQAEVLGEKGKREQQDPRPGNDTIYVMPENRKTVDLSKTDINRFHCERGELTGAIFSEDKGITVNRSGKDAFLRIVPETYAFEIPFELFMICSEDSESSVYRIIGNPVNELAKNVILKDDGGKVTSALNFFKGKDREQVLVEMIEKSWSENWEPYWKIIPRYQRVANDSKYNITWYRTIDTSSEWVIEQYIVEALTDDFQISETAFINRNTAAVSVFDPHVENGRLGQVVVIREIVDKL